eukprot:GHVP01026975.1.p1 GENE.GHVP01026975.1~~GHVP01026975.1.p1  ORF type:complete len:472 (+),score=119.19 GHVP01026975.1:633-2048(+)
MSKSVGTIFPPPELKGIIDKTALFVSRNGPDFESRVSREREPNGKLKFEFLSPESPFRAYYEMRVKEFKTGEVSEKPQVPQAILKMRMEEEKKKQKKKELLMLTQHGSIDDVDVKEPPPDNHILSHPYIAPVDMEIIKHTAQFVARNGQRFLMGLTQREKNNRQFDFLKPTHALFGYFTALVDSYILCLIPDAQELEKIKAANESAANVLIAMHKRHAYESMKENEARDAQRKETDGEEDPRSFIDWHDFAVVDVIEFDSKKTYPPSFDFTSGQAYIRPLSASSFPVPTAATKTEELPESETTASNVAGPKLPPGFVPKPSVDDYPPEKREKIGGFSSRPPSEAVTTRIVEDEGELVIRKDWVRKPKNVFSGTMQKCPITGRSVPTSQFTEHLRNLLQDPQWREQKDKLLERAKRESALASEGDVEYNLAAFVSRRPDLFGSVEDEILEHGVSADFESTEEERRRKSQKLL